MCRLKSICDCIIQHKTVYSPISQPLILSSLKSLIDIEYYSTFDILLIYLFILIRQEVRLL